jgi:hypothetical protein
VAYEETLRNVSLDADSSLALYTGVPGLPGSASPNSGNQFRFVKLTGAHQVGLADTTSGEVVIGVVQNKPQVVGQAVTVAIHGISMVEAGGTIAAGDGVGPDADGKAVSGGTDGVAIGSAAAGQLVPVLLKVS